MQGSVRKAKPRICIQMRGFAYMEGGRYFRLFLYIMISACSMTSEKDCFPSKTE